MTLGQSSFRRLLLSRLLLLTVPVLLMGAYVTHRKARSAFLENARQNLTKSAVRKAESINRSVEALKATLIAASNNTVLGVNSPKEQQDFVEKLSTLLPTEIECVQLLEIGKDRLVASTCDNRSLQNFTLSSWQPNKKQILANPEDIKVELVLPVKGNATSNSNTSISHPNRLELLFSVPVYDNQQQLRYALVIKSALLNQTQKQTGSLDGYAVIIDRQGRILAHPFPERIGLNIKELPDAERLESILRNALTGEENFLHLFYLDKNDLELIAGYSAIASPLSAEKDGKWAILSVSPLKAALVPLQEILTTLIQMLLGILTVTFFAILFIARELSRPLEKLRDYALNEKYLASNNLIPQNFEIREVKELAIALNDMLIRLKAWGEEIVTAWEEAQNANQLKNEFLATTSHELRTPLNGIIGSLRIIKDGYCDDRDEEMEYLEQADNAAIHLLKIIDDILNISKIEAGRLSVGIEKVNLDCLIQEVIGFEKSAIEQKGLKLILPETEETIFVDADPEKLKQVLINIIANAIKFTEIGHIKIDIRETVVNVEEAKHFVILSIKDTGIGIDPVQQHKLFRPFVMIDASRTRKFGGTGLGLAISRNLIELMDGTITLSSLGEGQGTTVEITLPKSN
jgi:signal transduction histidine kinase